MSILVPSSPIFTRKSPSLSLGSNAGTTLPTRSLTLTPSSSTAETTLLSPISTNYTPTLVQSPIPEQLPSLAGRRSIYIAAITVLLNKPVKGALYIKLLINGRDFAKLPYKYDPSPSTPVRWSLDPYFTLQEGNELTVHLMHRRHFPKKNIRSTATISFEQALRVADAAAETDGFFQHLVREDPSIVLDIVPETTSFADMLEAGIRYSSQVKSVLDHLGKSRRFLTNLIQYGVAISELDPIAKVILGCVNVTYKKLGEQDRYDRAIVDLAENMARALDFVQDVGQFARLIQLKRAIEDLRPLIEDTTNFIITFIHSTAAGRFFKGSQTRSQIEDLLRRFEAFQQQFDRGLSAQSGAALDVLLDALVAEKGNNLLDELRPRSLKWSDCIRVPECMDGTRQDVLSSIEDWVDDLKGSNILWVRGFPGVGKSAIASSLVQRLRRKNRFGASYIFDRAKATLATPNTLWRSVSYDLARTYPEFRKVVLQSLENEEVDVDSSNIKTIFRSLVEEPLLECRDIPTGRLPVVVVDALDECGGLKSRQSEHRQGLLSTLKRWATLPSHFKLVVTSRGDDDIARILEPISECLDLSSGNRVKERASEDIRLYLKARFRKIVKAYAGTLPADWPGESIIEELTERAAGLFIWAKTLMEYLNEGEPLTQLQLILEGGTALGDVFRLYAHLLVVAFRARNPSVLSAFQTVAGAMIFSKRPLASIEYIELFNIEPTMLNYICKGLRSVLDEGLVLRFNHNSFVEFLLDPARCDPDFAIQEFPQHYRLVSASLGIMNKRLTFNICRLPTSHLRNDQYEDLDQRIVEYATPQLTYACRYWADHLRPLPFDAEVFKSVECLLLGHFLHWLEILSIIGDLWAAVPMLGIVKDWIQGAEESIADLRILDFIDDALKFIEAFGAVMSQSAPHIYISALPFAPTTSVISRTFLHQFPGTLRLQSGHVEDWPPILFSIDEHEGCINSACFSADGKLMVSGAADGAVCVWDAETGDMVSSLEGHTGSVNSVAFAGDSRRVISASDDCCVYIWDAESGDIIAGPLTAHSNVVAAVAFSQSGAYAASGSYDHAVRLWSIDEDEVKSTPLVGHSAGVTSVAFSADDQRVASGSFDMTIRVWDVGSAQLVFGPFEGHTGSITSVAFSPDSLLVASASEDRTIQLWDVVEGEVATDPFEGHIDTVTSVAFSPDGKRVVSGAEDENICVWEVASGSVVCGPLIGHTNGVTTVSFSSDGRRVLSGSRDETLTVWDVAKPMEASSSSSKAHTDGVTAVVFTPDGRSLISGSDDNTVRLWDVETGCQQTKFMGHTSWIATVAVSPDGRYIASGSEDQTIIIWGVESGEMINAPLVGHRNGITSIAFFPDSEHLVSGSYDQTVRVWTVVDGQTILGPMEPHANWVTSVAVSPDGELIASASYDQTINIMNSTTGFAVVGPLAGHMAPINAVCFSSTGSLIASASNDSTICIWDVATGEMVGKPLVGHTNFVLCLGFSPGDEHLASGSLDKKIRVWDVRTGETVVGPMEGHTGGVFSISYSPDGKTLASASEDNTIRVWDVASDQIANEMSSVDFGDDSALQRGWVAGQNSSLLFWVPPWNRNGLWWPRNTLVISQSSTRLDLSCFENGLSWENCCLVSSR